MVRAAKRHSAAFQPKFAIGSTCNLKLLYYPVLHHHPLGLILPLASKPLGAWDGLPGAASRRSDQVRAELVPPPQLRPLAAPEAQVLHGLAAGMQQPKPHHPGAYGEHHALPRSYHRRHVRREH